MRTLVVGGVRAALGVGPGYEPQPLGTQASFDGRVAGYFVDLRLKTLAEASTFVTGRGQVYGLSATARAQRALGWWDRHLRGEKSAFGKFAGETEALLAAAEWVGDHLLWRYDVAVPKYGRRPPWYSCMAQGQAASVLVRAYGATGEARHADAALGAVRPLLEGRRLGLVTDTSVGPTLEECPGVPPSRILNGWIFALWGLWDVAAAIEAPDATALFEESTRALRAHLDDYDLGWWSLYSLFPGHRDVATPFYHRIHLTQLDVMYRLTGWREFRDMRERWCTYDRRKQRIRAVATKGIAAISDLRKRDRSA